MLLVPIGTVSTKRNRCSFYQSIISRPRKKFSSQLTSCFGNQQDCHFVTLLLLWQMFYRHAYQVVSHSNSSPKETDFWSVYAKRITFDWQDSADSSSQQYRQPCHGKHLRLKPSVDSPPTFLDRRTSPKSTCFGGCIGVEPRWNALEQAVEGALCRAGRQSHLS